MSRIKTFFKLSFDKKSLLIKSVVSILLIRIFLFILPFSRVYTISNKISRIFFTQKNSKYVEDIIWSVRVASLLIPKTTCLIQALTAQILMTHYNYDSVLKIGVNKSHNFEAHAWIEMNKKIVLGESEMDFIPILTLKPKF